MQMPFRFPFSLTTAALGQHGPSCGELCRGFKVFTSPPRLRLGAHTSYPYFKTVLRNFKSERIVAQPRSRVEDRPNSNRPNIRDADHYSTALLLNSPSHSHSTTNICCCCHRSFSFSFTSSTRIPRRTPLELESYAYRAKPARLLPESLLKHEPVT
jgi:hypothetical protein